jgi:hypothetical protein
MHPTLSFILPVQGRMDFLIEQINAVFKLSERYPGFCELIIVSDVPENWVFKLLWLAVKLNKVGHPYVRTRIIRFASQVEFEELVRTGIKSALGEKIIIATNTPLKDADVDGFRKRDVIVTRFLFNVSAFKNLA